MGERDIDLELVKRTQKGDKSAFDLLVRKYQHKVASLISRYITNPAEVQDVAQEAFIKAYRGLHNFRGDSAFYTWMYRIAVNTAKNFLSAPGRQAMGAALDADEVENYTDTTWLQDSATPEHELLSSEIRDTVYQSLAALPDDLRTAISLRELEGLSYEEIAVAMDCPIGTVRSRIFRAREAIENNLRPLMDDTGNADEQRH